MAEQASLTRLADIERFYRLLDRLSQRVGGPRMMASFNNFRDWPRRGVYFFFEPSEFRTDSGTGPRVVRIGTHALRSGARSTLRQRLRQHRGSSHGGGNHRGSIFRLVVGHALMTQSALPNCSSWGAKRKASVGPNGLQPVRDSTIEAERSIEQAVSAYLATLSVVCLSVDDEPGPHSLRGSVEQNVIGLLSNYGKTSIDPPSQTWLGHFSSHPLVAGSGLWNQQHVEKSYDPNFLDEFERRTAQSGKP
ncbi:MAG TPA: hypothetical protein VGL97_18865 [Bryobacteraceae bacterium]